MKNLKYEGDDVFIHPQSIIKYPELVSLDSHVAIDQFTTLGTSAQIGKYVHIAPNCSIIGGTSSNLIMGDLSGLSAGVRIIAGGDNFSTGMLTNPQVPSKYRDINISTVELGRFVIIGTNSVIMPGVKLAEGSMIGANSVVTKNTEPWMIYVGSPAKPFKVRSKGNILKFAKELNCI